MRIEKFLRFAKYYLIATGTFNFAFLICFLVLADLLKISTGYLELIIPEVANILQIGLWIFLIGLVQKLIITRKNDYSARIKVILLSSILLDILKSTFNYYAVEGKTVDFQSLSVGLEGDHPALSSLVRFYGENTDLISHVFNLLNPIPFGVAAFFWLIANKIVEDVRS